MKKFVVSVFALGMLLSPQLGHAQELQVDPLKNAYYYVWSTCANCGPQEKGLHLYISQIVFTKRHDYKNLGGAFYAKVRNMPHAAPNGSQSNGYLTYDGALAKRREFVSELKSRKYTVHWVRWATTRTGNHGDTKQGEVIGNGTTQTVQPLPPRPVTILPGSANYRYRTNTARRTRRNSHTTYRKRTKARRSRAYRRTYKARTRRTYKRRTYKRYKPRRTYKRRTYKRYKPRRTYKRRTHKRYKPRRIYKRRTYKRYKPRRTYKRRTYKRYKPRRTYRRTYRPRRTYRRTYKRYKPRRTYRRTYRRRY